MNADDVYEAKLAEMENMKFDENPLVDEAMRMVYIEKFLSRWDSEGREAEEKRHEFND